MNTTTAYTAAQIHAGTRGTAETTLRNLAEMLDCTSAMLTGAISGMTLRSRTLRAPLARMEELMADLKREDMAEEDARNAAARARVKALGAGEARA